MAARDVHALVEGFRRDRRRTVVLTTHNLVEAQRLCDRVLIMERGRALAVGSPAELAEAVVAARTVAIEIPAEHRAAAMTALTAAGVGEVAASPKGLTLHIDRREAIPAAIALLARAEIPIYRVAEREPDLEAAYFALHGRSPDASAVP